MKSGIYTVVGGAVLAAGVFYYLKKEKEEKEEKERVRRDFEENPIRALTPVERMDRSRNKKVFINMEAVKRQKKEAEEKVAEKKKTSAFSYTYNEIACLSYLKTYIHLASKSGLFKLSMFKRRLEDEPIELTETVSFISNMAEGINQGASFGGPIGGALGGAISLFIGIVEGIFKANDMAKQQKLLADWITNFCLKMGPPPSGLLHAGILAGIPSYDVIDWQIDLHVYFLRLANRLKERGWDFNKAPLSLNNQFGRLSADGHINLVVNGSFKEVKPSSKLGPWFAYCYHPEHLFQNPLFGDDWVKDYYQAYVDILRKNHSSPNEWFWFTEKDLEEFKSFVYGGKNAGFEFFEVGHDPFIKTRGKASMPKEQWLARFMIGSDPSNNFLISPRKKA